jgi:iron complex transport system ATP-binding protein
VQGCPLGELSPRQRAQQIAWLAQQGESGGELTVREVVQLGRLPWLGLFDAAGAGDEAAVESAMAATECAAWRDRRLTELSGGERQRVYVARALAVGAPIVLLDEPTAHIDALHQVALLRVLRRLGAEGRTVVSALHELTLAFAADRIVLLDQGRVRFHGVPGDAALQRATVDVFGGAIRIELSGQRWVVLPNLD